MWDVKLIFRSRLNIITEHNGIFHIAPKPVLLPAIRHDGWQTKYRPRRVFFFPPYKGPAPSVAKEYNIPGGHRRGKYVRYVPRAL